MKRENADSVQQKWGARRGFSEAQLVRLIPYSSCLELESPCKDHGSWDYAGVPSCFTASVSPGQWFSQESFSKVFSVSPKSKGFRQSFRLRAGPQGLLATFGWRERSFPREAHL